MFRAVFTARLSDEDYDLYCLVKLDHEYSENLLELLINSQTNYKIVDYHGITRLADIPDVLKGEKDENN